VNSIPKDDLRSYESLPAPPSKTPLSHLWVVPIIRSAVEKNPGVDYETLRNLIRPYAKDYSITNALVEFRLSMQEDETHHIGLVCKNLVTATEYQVRIPKVAYM